MAAGGPGPDEQALASAHRLSDPARSRHAAQVAAQVDALATYPDPPGTAQVRA